MSWSEARRAFLTVAAVAALAGCFRPMLAETTPAAGLVGQIALPSVDDRFGYHLRQSLEDRLGTPGRTSYRLDVSSDVSERGLAIAQDNAVTRLSLIATADYRLIRLEDGAVVLEDRVVSQSGYNSTASLFATRAAKRDVEERLARDIGERIGRSVLARAGALTAAPGG